MNIVDSSGWIVFFNDEANAGIFAEPIGNIKKLLVPTICVYEIFKFVKQKEGEVEAIKIAAQLKQGQVLPLTETIALEAANISINYKLAIINGNTQDTKGIEREDNNLEKDFVGSLVYSFKGFELVMFCIPHCVRIY